MKKGYPASRTRTSQETESFWLRGLLLIFCLISFASPATAETGISGIWQGECNWGRIAGPITFHFSQTGKRVIGTWQSPGPEPSPCGPWKGTISGQVSTGIFSFGGTSRIEDPDTCEVICTDRFNGTFEIFGDAMEGNGTERNCKTGEVIEMTCSPEKVEIDVEYVSFNWGPASGAVYLKQRIASGDEDVPVPEYVRDLRNEPAAYTRRMPLVVQVTFRANRYGLGKVKIWAEGSPFGLETEEVDFRGGLFSDPIFFKSTKNLPRRIAKTDFLWKWKYKMPGVGKADMAPTSHTLYTTWKSPVSQPVYKELIAWTSAWAKGKKTEKGICDAIISNLERSGLRYGIPGWSTGTILDNGGGMCGGFSNLFWDMANAQGVSSVYRRCFLLQNDAGADPEVKWVGIVIRDGGLNQQEPTYGAAEWRDVDQAYPEPRYDGDGSLTDDVEYRREKRYIFTSPSDGHCVNFLSYNGAIYLYDPSFGTGPFPGTFESIPLGPTRGSELSGFRKAYHDKAIDHMEGVIHCKEGSIGDLQTLDVKTRLIPDLRDPLDPSTFEIHYVWM